MMDQTQSRVEIFFKVYLRISRFGTDMLPLACQNKIWLNLGKPIHLLSLLPMPADSSCRQICRVKVHNYINDAKKNVERAFKYSHDTKNSKITDASHSSKLHQSSDT